MNIGEGHYQNSAEIKLFIAKKPEDISLQDFHIWGRGGGARGRLRDESCFSDRDLGIKRIWLRVR